MNFQIALSLIAAVAGIPAIIKIFFELPIVRRNRMREEFKFAKEFLAEVAENKQMHPYLREKGYQTIAGNVHLNADEVAYLLTLYDPYHENANKFIRYPDRALRDYIAGKSLLIYRANGGNDRIAFKDKYASPRARKWRKIVYKILYFPFFFAFRGPAA